MQQRQAAEASEQAQAAEQAPGGGETAWPVRACSFIILSGSLCALFRVNSEGRLLRKFDILAADKAQEHKRAHCLGSAPPDEHELQYRSSAHSVAQDALHAHV